MWSRGCDASGDPDQLVATGQARRRVQQVPLAGSPAHGPMHGPVQALDRPSYGEPGHFYGDPGHFLW